MVPMYYYCTESMRNELAFNASEICNIFHVEAHVKKGSIEHHLAYPECRTLGTLAPGLGIHKSDLVRSEGQID